MEPQPIIYKLEIRKENDSVYWTEHFTDLARLNAWLAEEQTRPYWDNTNTHEILVLDDQNQWVPYVEEE